MIRLVIRTNLIEFLLVVAVLAGIVLLFFRGLILSMKQKRQEKKDAKRRKREQKNGSRIDDELSEYRQDRRAGH